MRLEILKALEPSLDQIFDDFYDAMLSNPDFSGYFSGKSQIIELKEKQKKYFSGTFKLTDEELKKDYVAIGEMHYKLKLPYVDFSAAVTILQEGAIHAIYDASLESKTLDAAFHFFNLVRAYTAKGYLNCMLAQDIHDINMYLGRVGSAEEPHNAMAIDRMLWLKNFIYSIQTENRNIAPSFHIEPEIIANLETSLRQDEDFVEYLSDMISRIRIDASNVFYFLDKQDYNDVLPLYRELLSVYKLSLMLTNLLTASYTNVVLQDLHIDPLTGCLSKDTAVPFIEKEEAVATAQNYQISLLFLDVDYFKAVNDTYGHTIGDDVLVAIASLIKGAIRATDFVFRVGGEEFLIMLKAAPENVAIEQAESIRKIVEEAKIEASGVTLDVTVSIGVATFQTPFALSVKDSIAQVDKLMYKAKQQGRNCVVDK